MLAEKLVTLAREKNITFGTAESCTGGLISAAVTDISGASAVFWGGIVSYDNRVKEHLLGVEHETLVSLGAVSAKTAEQMALGAVRALSVDFAVSVTGIAGPGGGTPEKPVGLVYIAVASTKGVITVKENHFKGEREEVRRQTVETALSMLISAIEET
ncbi:MAG: nicotinamide-nucleotide amidohydrolase family protein [Clostridia bacterium]|nr:nicotinamide-nucleotide amidohydrolase family protein [Clostridia bacterium]